jgi:hypothetical protein
MDSGRAAERDAARPTATVAALKTLCNELSAAVTRQLQGKTITNSIRTPDHAGTWELGRKDRLCRNLAAARRLKGGAFDIAPRRATKKGRGTQPAPPCMRLPDGHLRVGPSMPLPAARRTFLLPGDLAAFQTELDHKPGELYRTAALLCFPGIALILNPGS